MWLDKRNRILVADGNGLAALTSSSFSAIGTAASLALITVCLAQLLIYDVMYNNYDDISGQRIFALTKKSVILVFYSTGMAECPYIKPQYL